MCRRLNRLYHTLPSGPAPTRRPPASRPASPDASRITPYAPLPSLHNVYPKRKSPHKRAASLLSALSTEEQLRLQATNRAIFPLKVPKPRAGDVLRVSYVHHLPVRGVPHCFTGVCIAVRKRGLGSSVLLRNVIDGVPVERYFPIYSPLVRDVQVVGKKRAKRAKLYYLRLKPLKESTTPGATRRPTS